MQLTPKSISHQFQAILSLSSPPPPTPPVEEIKTPPANRLIDLVKEHYPVIEPLLSLPDYAHHAARIMEICHTSALGGHVEQCPDGHINRIFYNSCGHRFCPRCAGRVRHRWLLARQKKILPVRHYHTIFTLPHTFNGLWLMALQSSDNGGSSVPQCR